MTLASENFHQWDCANMMGRGMENVSPASNIDIFWVVSMFNFRGGVCSTYIPKTRPCQPCFKTTNGVGKPCFFLLPGCDPPQTNRAL